MAIEAPGILILSEMIMPFLGYWVFTERFNLALVATTGAVGHNVGSMLAYFAGRSGGRRPVLKWGRILLISDNESTMRTHTSTDFVPRLSQRGALQLLEFGHLHVTPVELSSAGASRYPIPRIRDASANKRGEAMAILDRVGMAQFADVRPQRLSGGEQQRVGVARALASKPDLLLFDEALSSLDVDIRERMRLEIRELAHETGAAALFVSHDPLDAWRLADRVAVLEGGRLTQTATPAELYASPTTARVARFIGAVGGFAMEIVSDGGQVGIRFAGRFCAARHHKVEPGERGIIYVRPEGVRQVLDGIPAELEFSTFEAGQHRAYWRIVGTDATVRSLEQAPPTGHAATLSIASEHLLIYPENGVP